METTNGIVEQADQKRRAQAPLEIEGIGPIRDTRSYIMQLLLNWECGRERILCPFKSLRVIKDMSERAYIVNNLPEKTARRVLKEHFICSGSHHDDRDDSQAGC